MSLHDVAIRLRNKHRVVATAVYRSERYPGARKDDTGGRFPGSRFRRLQQAFPERVASVAMVDVAALPLTVAGTAAVLHCVPF